MVELDRIETGEGKGLPVDSGKNEDITQAIAFERAADSAAQSDRSGFLGDDGLWCEMIKEGLEESEGLPESVSLCLLNGLFKERWPDRARQLEEWYSHRSSTRRRQGPATLEAVFSRLLQAWCS